MSPRNRTRCDTFAFTLIEVVLALAVCTFVLVAVLGLFTTGLQSSHDSEQQIQAANLTSMLISVRTASPVTDIPHLPNFAIPTAAMTGPYQNAYDGGATLTKYIGLDGQTTPTAATAAYAISCRAGTNLVTGSEVAQVYLMLSWPPQADPTSAVAGHYEVVAYIPLR